MSNAISDENVVRKFANNSQGTLIILEGYRLYKGGVLTLSGEDYEKHRKELARLVASGHIVEAAADAKPVLPEKERTFDPLDQAEEVDKDNLFYKPKNQNVMMPNYVPDNASTEGNTVNGEDVRTVQTSEAADRVKIASAQEKPMGSREVDGDRVTKVAAGNEDEIAISETVKDNFIDGDVKSLQSDSKTIEDGYDGNQRKISCVTNVADWREAVSRVKEVNNINELDIIIRNDVRPSVRAAAEQRRNEIKSRV